MKVIGNHNSNAVIALATMTLALSACAVGTPASITSSQSDPRYVTNVELLKEAGENGLRARFSSELSRAIAARGVSLSADARFVADFAVSERPAGLGLQPISQETPVAKAATEVLSSGWLDECKPNRVSASLVVYSRESGTIQAKSSGEFLTCPGDLSQLGDLAQLLVNRTFRK